MRYAGPAQDGSTVGNCFSEAFGGSCSGTPRGCRDCNTAITCKQGGTGGEEGPAPGKTGLNKRIVIFFPRDP